jgi:hypothetical protein
MGLTSSASGGGQLEVNWDFDGLPVARTADSGLAGVFTGNIPGVNDGTGNGTTTFTLQDGADFDVEVTAIDDGMRWIFDNGTIDGEGDTALLGTMPDLHNHATFEITAPEADNRTFAEGRISFRFLESSATPVGYTPSDVHSLIVSNGYLPPLADATDAHLKCQSTLALTVRGLIGKTYLLLGKCLDAALEHTMLEKSAMPALKRCSLDETNPKSLVGAIAKEKEKAVEKIAKKCGPLSDASVPYTESQVHTHVGMAVCRAEEMVGATYNHAAETIGTVLETAGAGGHHEVQHALPCMKASFE